jgi:anthranilate synthase/aminodeoxychorismate synthase-like glutamine amidotransferase
VSSDVVRHCSGKIPILGVCLGHQCIGEVFGGQIVRAERLVHGKTSAVIHTGRGLFLDIDNPFQATRYHSLILSRDGLPDSLQVMAWTPENEIMAIRHKEHETWGVQFHPESILTTAGKDILKNFLLLLPAPSPAGGR